MDRKYNFMAARTNGAKQMASGNVFMKVLMNLYYKFKGKDVEELVGIIVNHISKNTKLGLEAYILEKDVDITMDTFNKNNAIKLEEETKLLFSNLK